MNKSGLRKLIKEVISEVESISRHCVFCDALTHSHNNNVSHGYCREHYINYWMEMMGLPKEKAIAMADKVEKEGGFPPNTSGAKIGDPLPDIFNK